jgi:hypothetical protein
MDSGPAALPPRTARRSRPAPVLPWADSACADPEFACTRAERRTLPVASRPGLPSNGVARLQPIPVRYLERESPIPTDRGSRKCIRHFRGAEAGTRAGGGFASVVVGQSLVRFSRERAAERREALLEKGRPVPKTHTRPRPLGSLQV